MSAACVSESFSDDPATALVDDSVVPLTSTESLVRAMRVHVAPKCSTFIERPIAACFAAD